MCSRFNRTCVLPWQMNALVVREISKGNGTFGFELEHDEKGPKKREGAHQVEKTTVLSWQFPLSIISILIVNSHCSSNSHCT